MHGRRRAHAGFNRRIRRLTAAHAFHPICQMKQFPIRFVVEFAAVLFIGSEDQLLKLSLTALRDNLITAAVDVQPARGQPSAGSFR